MMNLSAVHEFAASKRSTPLTLVPRETYNRADNAIVVPAQRKSEAVASFFGEKGAALLLGAGLGMMDAQGEPMFFTSASDPNSGIGLVALTAATLSAAELAMLWFGWSPSKKVSGMAGDLLDGALHGAATTAVGVWSYKQGNLYAMAKASGGTKTKGFEPDYDAPARQFAPAPMRSEVAPETVAAARERIKHDPHAAFF